MSTIPDPTRVVVPEGQPVGGGVAELWCGSAFLGILQVERGGVVLRLESHASGPLVVNAIALERALSGALSRLAGQCSTS